MADKSYVFDVTTERFQQLVLENSMHVPVLVDFWAEWCNPCKALTPVLTKLADEYGGKFLVAKINTEQEQQLAAHFQIRSIPSVKLVYQGKIVDEFMGALPEAEIRSFLDKHLPRESDALLAQADALLLQGDAEGAEALLKQAKEIDPESSKVKLSYGRYLATLGELDEAEKLLRALPAEVRESPEVAAMLARIEIDRASAGSPPAAELEKRLQENPADSEALHLLAAHRVMDNDFEGALELLLTLLQKDRGYGDNAAQKEMLRIFELLGGQGELVKRYRNRMFNLLH